jgi:hypothetical protein
VAEDTTAAKTIYAHWELKPVSDWTLKTDMPSDAQLVSTKYSYTHTQSSSSAATPSNYYYVSTAYGGWSGWSAWQNSSIGKETNPYNGDILKDVRTQTVAATYKTQYHYYRHYRSGKQEAYTGPGLIDGVYHPLLDEIWIDYQLSLYGGSSIMYQGPSVNGNPFWLRADIDYNRSVSTDFTRSVQVSDAYTQWSSQTRSATYTYRRDNIETTANPNGQSGVSNVKEYVQYRTK